MQNTQIAIDHFKTHHTKWPATYDELIAECNQLSDFSEEDRKEFMEKLPKDKTYNSADEVIAVMGWTTEGTSTAPQGGDQTGGIGQGGMGGGTPGGM